MKYMLKLFLISIIFIHPLSFAETEITNDMRYFSVKANEIEQWQRGTTKRFDTFVQFFLQAQGIDYYKAGYLFDLHNVKWLSYDEAINVAPSLKDVLNKQKLTVNITLDELITFTNIQLPQKSQYVYLYFDMPTAEDGSGRYMFGGDSSFAKLLVEGVQFRKSAALTLQKHGSIPWFLIDVPLVGFKPQKFF
jgi:hypothetical protein